MQAREEIYEIAATFHQEKDQSWVAVAQLPNGRVVRDIRLPGPAIGKAVMELEALITIKGY